MADTTARPLWLRILLIVAQIVLAIVAGFFLMWPLAVASDFLRLSYFNTWSLVHGGFGAAWPMLAIFCFAVLGYVKWFYRVRDAAVFAAGILLGLVLQGLTRMPEPPDYVSASVPLLLVACVGSALLAYVARRWFLLALLIGFPSWLELVSWLHWEALFDPEGRAYLAVTMAQSLPLPMAALTGAALADLVRRFQRR